MKIALVSPYDFAHPGGVVNHISCLEQQLTRMDHEVKIIAPASKAISTFGDRFIPVGKPRPVPVSGSIARITLSPWLSSRIKEILGREKFDIIHLHEPLMPMLCTSVLRHSQTPNVGTFHASGGKPWYSFGTPIGRLLLKKWADKLDGKTAVSQVAMEYVSKHFPGDYTITPNGVDCEHFSPEAIPIEEFNDGKLNIVFIGRLEKRKGLDYLIEAYRQIKPEIPDSRLIIVGPGTRLRRKYEKRIRRNRLEDVVFIGYTTYDDLSRYYKTADVVCCPATGQESFGIVLIEAMAVGKPIIASDIPGYNSVVTHGTEGLLVSPKNAAKLAEALTSLLPNESLRQQMGTRGRVKAQEYDWAHLARNMVHFYLDVLNTPRWKEESLKPETLIV
ncbi:MAG: glycosyltransferase family 4 protein [Dehalococcoidales bacterium]|jgi:phosphatidylinositol alpha-mannosyltransferase|nr:glycosyltransferase family 4 protein [Dehalococcoidales bacterium]